MWIGRTVARLCIFFVFIISYDSGLTLDVIAVDV